MSEGSQSGAPHGSRPIVETRFGGTSSSAPSSSAGLLTEGADQSGSGPRPVEPQWPCIGRLELRGRLGTGGMGSVYEAYDPSLERAVAVKLLHAQMPRAARLRMQREALALAKLSHPNVVQVFEVGEHEGHVFIVMELVRGRTLDAWARRQPPPTWQECVAVYAQAGAGLFAAHVAGLAHRDLKPSNCILGDDGRVRVVDFGLAKAIAAPDDDSLAVSGTTAEGGSAELDPGLTQGRLVGTPAYMAPEQLARRSVGPAADQFSLCASLWEALHGQRPFVGQSLPELSLQILEGRVAEPPAGASVPRWLRAIVRRGLSVDPQQRWPSMGALLEAIERGQARARRYRWRLGLGSVVAVGLVVAGGYWVDRRRQVHACEAEGAGIDAVWNDEIADATTAAWIDTELVGARVASEKVRPWLDAQARAWREARTEACLDAHVRGAWDRSTLERATWCLDERRMELAALVAALGSGAPRTVDMAVPAAAELGRIEPCRDPLTLARSSVPPLEQREPIQAVRAELQRAEVLARMGAYPEGLVVAQSAVAEAQALGWRPLVASAHMVEGLLLEATGELAQAEATLEDAFFEAEAVAVPEVAVRVAGMLTHVVGSKLGRNADGRRWSRQQGALLEGLPDPEGLRRARYLHDLAIIEREAGELGRAKELLLRALEIQERAYGPEHPGLSRTLAGLANMHIALGDYAQAMTLHERALHIDEQALGPEHPKLAGHLNNLARVHADMGDSVQAKQLYERALEIRERTLGPSHPELADSLTNLGTVYDELGDRDRAQAMHERALRIREATLGPHNIKVAQAVFNLATVHHARGEHERAEALYERALGIAHEVLQPDHPELAMYLHGLATLYQDMGELERAKVLYERALPLAEASLGLAHPLIFALLNNLALIHQSFGACDRAEPMYERALSALEGSVGPDHPDLASTLSSLAGCRLQRGDLDGAQTANERALRIVERSLGVEPEAVVHPLLGLADVAMARGRPDEAVPWVERVLALGEKGVIDAELVERARALLRAAPSEAPLAPVQ